MLCAWTIFVFTLSRYKAITRPENLGINLESRIPLFHFKYVTVLYIRESFFPSKILNASLDVNVVVLC